MTADCDVNKALPDLVLDIDNEEEVNQTFHREDSVYSENTHGSQPDNQTAGPSQAVNVLNRQSSCDEQKSVKTDTRSTPRRTHLNSSRGNSKLKQNGGIQGSIRLCEQHTFLTDITEVRQMEQGLLKLLDDFHCGKLQAFGKDCTFEKMEQVREQQERLARLHFELNAQQEIYGPYAEEGSIGRENLGKLIENLQQLSRSIEQLQVSSPSVQTDV